MRRVLVRRSFGGEDVAPRDQRVDQVGRVDQQQHDRYADAQVLVGQPDVGLDAQLTGGEIEDRRQQQRDHHEDQQAREQTGLPSVEGERGSSDGSHHDRESESEQAGADDRSRDLRAHDRDIAGPQHEECEDQFGKAAEADVHQSPDRRTELLCELLGRSANPVRQHADREGPCCEDHDRRRVDEGEDRRDRHDREQAQRHAQSHQCCTYRRTRRHRIGPRLRRPTRSSAVGATRSACTTITASRPGPVPFVARSLARAGRVGERGIDE